jgi:hypothetical protein
MTIIDLDGQDIQVNDLDLAIMQADDYRHYRVTDPSDYQLHLYAYWQDLYEKLVDLRGNVGDS